MKTRYEMIEDLADAKTDAADIDELRAAYFNDLFYKYEELSVPDLENEIIEMFGSLDY